MSVKNPPALSSRKYLTPDEMALVLAWIKRNAFLPVRDYLMSLMAYRHGLRVSELLSLRWQDVNREDRAILITRLKNGKHNVQPLQEDELRGIVRLKNYYKNNDIKCGPFMFVGTKTHLPLNRNHFNRICDSLNNGQVVPIKVTPHTFRHSCGYYLASKGYDTRLIQDYLGHRNISNTEIYTQLAAVRFKSITW